MGDDVCEQENFFERFERKMNFLDNNEEQLTNIDSTLSSTPSTTLLNNPTERRTNQSKINEIEERIQRDEGKRGIQEILLPIGELFHAATSLISKKRVGILTGFPCLLDYTPPTETDGPLGTVAIAKTLIEFGKEVIILTDECNEEPMLASVAGAGLSNPLLTLESFPSRNDFDDDDFLRLEELSR